MPAVTSKLAAASVAVAMLAASTNAALAQKKYDTGATDTEIKIGNIMLLIPVLLLRSLAAPAVEEEKD